MQGDFEAFLKWVAYPFIPSKSAMYQPGNNSSWPKVQFTYIELKTCNALQVSDPGTIEPMGRSNYVMSACRHCQSHVCCRFCYFAGSVQVCRFAVCFVLVSSVCRHTCAVQLLGVLRFLVDYLKYEHKRAALLPQQASLGAAHEHWENCEPHHVEFTSSRRSTVTLADCYASAIRGSCSIICQHHSPYATSWQTTSPNSSVRNNTVHLHSFARCVAMQGTMCRLLIIR